MASSMLERMASDLKILTNGLESASADLTSIADCNMALLSIDKTASDLACLRWSVSGTKARLANQWISDNLMTSDECYAIIHELASTRFSELSEDSSFFTWLKKFYNKFLAGSDVALVNATTDAEDWNVRCQGSRKELYLWFAHASDPSCSVVVGIPLPDSIHPKGGTQRVVGGINLYASKICARIRNGISYDRILVLTNEYDLDKIKSMLGASVGAGEPKKIIDFAPKSMRWKVPLDYGESPWWTHCNDCDMDLSSDYD